MTTVTIAEAPAARLIGAAAVGLAARAQASVVQIQGRGQGGGSGLVWGDGRMVMTNYHVLAGVGEPITILSHTDRRYQVQLIAGNPRLDLALLALIDGHLPPAPLGDSTRLRVGELVFAVGNPWGQRGVVTAGVVSALSELPAADDEQPASYIRSDVRLAPGNSGGPLLNAQGEVVGINAMIFGGDLSVAIPSHVAAAWVAHVPARPVFLGVGLQTVELPPELATGGQRTGLLVAQVATHGPAAIAGVCIGDLLLALNGQPLTASGTLLEALATHAPGDMITLDLLRAGQPLQLTPLLVEQGR